MELRTVEDLADLRVAPRPDVREPELRSRRAPGVGSSNAATAPGIALRALGSAGR